MTLAARDEPFVPGHGDLLLVAEGLTSPTMFLEVGMPKPLRKQQAGLDRVHRHA